MKNLLMVETIIYPEIKDRLQHKFDVRIRYSRSVVVSFTLLQIADAFHSFVTQNDTVPGIFNRVVKYCMEYKTY